MKTNIPTDHRRPFHLHLEYFFRKQYCILVMLAFLMFAITKTDGKFMGVMREAYAQGFGMVGQYMREETTRMPQCFDVGMQAATHSGR